MDIEIFLYTALLIFLLLLSAFFSGSETAFFSLNLLERDKLRKRIHGKVGVFIAEILAAPEHILITILTGNMLVNLLFASLMDRLVARFIESNAWLYSILFGTFLVLIFGEMAPKNIAVRHSISFFSFSSRPLFLIHSFFFPIRKIILAIEGRIVSYMTGKVRGESVDKRILMTSTLQVGLQKGILHQSEMEILESFLDFREKTASDIMVPRIEIAGVEISEDLKLLIERLAKPEAVLLRGRHDLIPAYHEDLDHLVGYFNLQDLLPYRFDLKGESDISGIIKPVHPVPQKKNLPDLLREMIESGRKMAVVIDEYGGTAGIITFQHLIEDFLSFFYPSDDSEYAIVAEGVYRFPGKFALEDLEKLLGVEFNSDSRTLAGLIIGRTGEIPVEGKRILIAGHTLVVRRVARNRILEVEVAREQ